MCLFSHWRIDPEKSCIEMNTSTHTEDSVEDLILNESTRVRHSECVVSVCI
jgi:hypothetical protein